MVFPGGFDLYKDLIYLKDYHEIRNFLTAIRRGGTEQPSTSNAPDRDTADQLSPMQIKARHNFSGDFESLALFLAAISFLRSKDGSAPTSLVSEKLLETPVDKKQRNRKLKNELTKVESYFNISIFNWPKGNTDNLTLTGHHSEKKSVFNSTDGIDRTLNGIEDLIRDFLAIGGKEKRPVIRIGCGRALSPWFIPNVVQSYRAKLEESQLAILTDEMTRFEVEIRVGLPQDLRRDGTEGLFDIVVTSFDDKIGSRVPNTEVAISELPMHLVAARSRSDEFFKFHNDPEGLVAGKILITTGGIRSPSLRAHHSLLEKAEMVWEYDQWSEALAVIDCGSTAVICATYPQIFPPEKRSQYAVMPLLDSKYDKLLLGALRRTDGRNRSKQHKEVTDGIFKELKKRLHAMEGELNSDSWHDLSCHTLYTTHVTKIGEGDFKWIRGRLSDCAISPCGTIRATHRFKSPSSVAQTYAVLGEMTKKSGALQISWHASSSKLHSDASDDTYAFSAVKKWVKNPLEEVIGVWTGRATWMSGTKPSMGFFAIHNHRSLTIQHLNSLAETLGPEFETMPRPVTLVDELDSDV